MLQGGAVAAATLQRVAKIDAALPPDICAFSDKPDIVFSRLRPRLRRAKGEADPPCQNFDERRRNWRRLLQQRGDERAFFRQ